MAWEDGLPFVIETSLIFNYNFSVILHFDVHILLYNKKKMPFSCHLSRNKLYLLRQSILSKLKNKSLVHCHTCGCRLWILDNFDAL